MINPVSQNNVYNQKKYNQLKQDAVLATVLGTGFGTAQTIKELKNTSKLSGFSIKEMSKMFDNKLKFLTSTTLFKNIGIQSLQLAGLFAVCSIVVNAVTSKSKKS